MEIFFAACYSTIIVVIHFLHSYHPLLFIIYYFSLSLLLLLLSLWGRRQASGGQKRLPGDDGQLKDIVVWKVAQYQKLFLKSKWKPDYDWTVASLWKKFGKKRHFVSVCCCYLPLLSLSTTAPLFLEISWVSIRAHNLCHDNRQLIVLAINCNHSASKNNCN